jgi:hypothetical protein
MNRKAEFKACFSRETHHSHRAGRDQRVDRKRVMRMVVWIGRVDQELRLVRVDVLRVAVWNGTFGSPLDEHLLPFLPVWIDQVKLKRKKLDIEIKEEY